jgi:hypothetical protein
MKKGRFAGYVAVVYLVTTLLQTCPVAAFLADAAPQPFASGWSVSALLRGDRCLNCTVWWF